MNKKLMAVAVAGAFAVPAVAFAQASNVQIAGRAQLSFANVKAEGATAGSNANIKGRNRVDDNSSRLIFRGTEDLGGGLKAIFLMEEGVNMDTGDASRGSTGYPASREAYVGLAGSWLVYDAIRLRRFWPQGERAHDEIFGSIIGIAVSLCGLAGVVRFYWGG